MNAQRINLALAVVFLIVGILATVNTFRLNTYIKHTLPRDQAQEKCMADTVAVMKRWVQARNDYDAAVDFRDEATMLVMIDVLAGQQAKPEDIAAWHDAIEAEHRSRHYLIERLVPLPNC